MTGVLTIENIKPEHAKQATRVQRIAMPTLGEDELLREEHYLSHARIFPEGNFVAIVEGKVVGVGTGFLTHFDMEHPNHRFMDFIDNGYLRNHNPKGEWYYGVDICVHPDYRKRGIGRQLYQARKQVIKNLNRRGLVAGGLLPHYIHYKHKMTVHDYVKRVIAGKLYDPTLSFQLEQGFVVKGMIRDYLEDIASDNWATLIVWHNPDYRARMSRAGVRHVNY